MEAEIMKKKPCYTAYSKEKYLQAFLMGFFTLLAALLPIMIFNKGYFIYYGDFNAQQIPFYNLANDAVRDGQFGWNWYTDLGSDFMTSYSFYLFGSPFFWLSTLLPRALVTYSIPFLLALKHGVASLTAYIYIRRFVRSKEAALTGAMLYAFSGFQLFNIFFNHFQDVTAFFPLMLIAMEENINNRRRGWFALITALMAVINYFFFTGEVVFLILYFIVRVPSRDFHATWKKFFGLLLEAILGTAIAGFILLPSAISLMGNYRISEHLTGNNVVIYHEGSRIFRAIQAFFLPVEPPAVVNLFQSEYAKWSSVGGYFPLFSMLGVITFMRTRKKHWAVRISVICIICSMIPILNSAFYAFNASYYARWFYMPILIFAMMTAQTLDDAEADFRPAVKLTVVIMAAFGLISCIPIEVDGKLKWFSFPLDFGYFWVTVGVAVISLVAAVYIIRRRNKRLAYKKHMVWGTAAASVMCLAVMIGYMLLNTSFQDDYTSQCIEGGDSICEEVDQDNFFRVDTHPDLENYPMIWKLPTIRCFQSVVAPSIMEFYDYIGIERDVASRPEADHYTLRGLLSVKYYYIEVDDIFDHATLQRYKKNSSNTNISSSSAISESDSKSSKKDKEFSIPSGIDEYTKKIIKEHDVENLLPGFKFLEGNEKFEIFENEYYIPMGFGYDTYISKKTADSKVKGTREKFLIDSLILSDEQIEKYSDIMEESPKARYAMLSKDDYAESCLQKQQNCSKSFRFDSKGFESMIDLDKPQLVFFSVPYSDGWSAEVNGRAVDVEKVSCGFMAVRAEEGENTIVFRYETPGLKTGWIITISGAVLLAVYLIICRFTDRKLSFSRFRHCYEYESCSGIKAHEDYLKSIINGKEEK